MPRIAFTSIEEQSDGRWVCLTDTIIRGQYCAIKMHKGQTFPPRTAFGGYNDFTSYLASVSVDAPTKSPHEWP